MTTRTTTFTQTLDTSTKTSDTFDPFDNGQAFGFSVGVTGTFVANWRLQRSLDAGSTWVDFVVLDRPDIVAIPTQAPALWRVTAAGTGDFTSGSAALIVQKGGHQSATPLTRLLNKDGTVASLGSPYSASFSIARTADTTPYNGGDVIGVNNAGSAGVAAFELAGIGPAGGGVVLITTTRFRIDVASVPFGMSSFKLALFAVTPPSALLDNVAFTLPSGDRASFRGFVPLGAPVDEGDSLYVESLGPVNKQVTVPAGGSLFAYLITSGGYTPGSGDVHSGVIHSILVG